ncbi:hypothetical protein ACFSRY_08830 [Pontibacter locisalis]|uniref:Magnesium citrate secondary transporter n=1 Tax=Pontibacter locisalis TaxID=1719035 RepID=A0ABW5IK18_9BACT
MKTLCHPLFLLCLLLFGLNQLLELSKVYVWPLYTHLDDLLVLPITLTIALAAERAYFNSHGFVLPLRYSLLAFVLFSAVFEGVLPLISQKYTADALDVVAYALGTAAFQLLINRPLKNHGSKV